MSEPKVPEITKELEELDAIILKAQKRVLDLESAFPQKTIGDNTIRFDSSGFLCIGSLIFEDQEIQDLVRFLNEHTDIGKETTDSLPESDYIASYE